MVNINSANSKEIQLRSWMRGTQKLLVAYSGGVDSSYLALIATEELGEKAICVTGVSPSVSDFQLETAVRIAGDNSFRHSILETFEMNDPDYVANAGNRCYFCKSELFQKIREFAETEAVGAVIVDGTNADDLGGHRPGTAAAAENSVVSPLADLGFTKAEVREMSLLHGLETWDMPASPCLSSRVAVGVPVTIERLNKVEKGEVVLRKAGFSEFRLRVRGETARIEVAVAEMKSDGFMDVIGAAAAEIKSLGFTEVSLDLSGFRSGSHSLPVDYSTASQTILL